MPVLAPGLAITVPPAVKGEITPLPAQALPGLLSEAELSLLRKAPLMPLDATARLEQAVPFVIPGSICHPGLDKLGPNHDPGGSMPHKPLPKPAWHGLRVRPAMTGSGMAPIQSQLPFVHAQTF